MLVTFTSSKINVIHSIQESNLHIYYYTAQKPRGEKASLGWKEEEEEEEEKGGGGGVSQGEKEVDGYSQPEI